MKAHELKRAKRDVRRGVLAERDLLPPAVRADRAAAIAERVLGLEEMRSARTVLAFWSFGSEVPTAPMLRGMHDLGLVVALPRIEGAELQVLPYEPGDPLAETTFGAMEPAGGDPIDPTAIDVIVTPGVAFDRQGRRVGYGGGFYDRLFPLANRARRIAVAFDLQVVDASLPAGRSDWSVHAIVTETGTIRCSGST